MKTPTDSGLAKNKLFYRTSLGADRPAPKSFFHTTKNAFVDKRATVALNSKEINSMVVDDVDIIYDLTVK